MYETKNYTTDGKLKTLVEDCYPLKGASKAGKRKIVKKYYKFVNKFNPLKIELVFIRNTNYRGHIDKQIFRGKEELVNLCESENFDV